MGTPDVPEIPAVQGISVISSNSNGDIIQYPFPPVKVSPEERNPGADTVYLRLALRGKKCAVYYKTGFSWNEYNLVTTIDLDFNPVYIGLAAFQGWSRDDYSPKGADAIPAFFDWMEAKRQ